MSTKRAMREALNQINVVGTVKENNLELRSGKDALKDKRTGEPYNAIMGDLVIKVGESGEHRLKFFSKEKTNAGEDNQLFKAYNTARENYISIADVARLEKEREDDEARRNQGKTAEGIEEEKNQAIENGTYEEPEPIYPTRVSITGEIRSNDYSKDGVTVSETPELSGRFLNSLKEDEEDKAEFDLEFYIESMNPEMDKDGIETGRLKVNAIVPGYLGRIVPIPLIITDEFGVADYMGMNFRVGDTLQVWGKVVNSVERKTVVKEGFGKSKEEIVSTYTNEIVVVGGEESALEGDKAYSDDDIAAALKERDVFLEQVKARGKQRAGSAPKKTAGFGKVASKQNVTPKKPVSSDEIPF